MDKVKVGKYAMTVLGMVLTAAGTFINTKTQDAKMEEVITKKVAEALKDQNKGA